MAVGGAGEEECLQDLLFAQRVGVHQSIESAVDKALEAVHLVIDLEIVRPQGVEVVEQLAILRCYGNAS